MLSLEKTVPRLSVAVPAVLEADNLSRARLFDDTEEEAINQALLHYQTRNSCRQYEP